MNSIKEMRAVAVGSTGPREIRDNFTTVIAPLRKRSPEQIFQSFEQALIKAALRQRMAPAAAYRLPDLGPAPLIRWALRPWAVD